MNIYLPCCIALIYDMMKVARRTQRFHTYTIIVQFIIKSVGVKNNRLSQPTYQRRSRTPARNWTTSGPFSISQLAAYSRSSVGIEFL